MRLNKILLLSVISSIGFVSAAQAQNLNTSEACTTPRGEVVNETDDDRWVYCDIYMRQFQHRERMIELTKSLESRAKNYQASTKSVRDNYRIELQKYHDSLGSDSE